MNDPYSVLGITPGADEETARTSKTTTPAAQIAASATQMLNMLPGRGALPAAPGKACAGSSAGTVSA